MCLGTHAQKKALRSGRRGGACTGDSPPGRPPCGLAPIPSLPRAPPFHSTSSPTSLLIPKSRVHTVLIATQLSTAYIYLSEPTRPQQDKSTSRRAGLFPFSGETFTNRPGPGDSWVPGKPQQVSPWSVRSFRLWRRPGVSPPFLGRGLCQHLALSLC